MSAADWDDLICCVVVAFCAMFLMRYLWKG